MTDSKGTTVKDWSKKMNHRENWITDKRDRIIESSKGMEFDEGSVSVGVRSLIGNLRFLFRVLD